MRVVDEAWVNDDALISFRYAENLARGDGLAFNPGEPVEGFSNPTWTLLLVPFAALGLDLFTTSMVLGGICAATTLALVLATIRDVVGSRPRIPAMLCAGLWMATDRIVAVWSTGGLETPLAALLTAALLWNAARHRRAPTQGARAGALLVVALCATRPDGIAIALLCPVYLVVAGWRDGSWRESSIRVANVALPLLAGLLAVRFLYYGAILPNTYQAKVGGVPWDDVGSTYGVQFLRRLGLLHPLHVVPWIAIAVVAVVAWRRARHRELTDVLLTVVAGTVIVAAYLAIAVAEGGDYMNDFRFLAPAMPAMAVVVGGLAHLAVGVDAPFPWRGAGAAGLLALAVSHGIRQDTAVPIAPDAPPSARHKLGVGATRAQVARFAAALARIAEPGDALVVDRAGANSYGHRYRTIDATGLVSRHVARDFYLREPFDDEGRRVRFPGHARWPRVEMMTRERIAFIFPTVAPLGPDVRGVDASSPRRRIDYPFFHVTMPLGDGLFFRFFTTWTEAEIERRAGRHGVELCYHLSLGPTRCTRGQAP